MYVYQRSQVTIKDPIIEVVIDVLVMKASHTMPNVAKSMKKLYFKISVEAQIVAPASV